MKLKRAMTPPWRFCIGVVGDLGIPWTLLVGALAALGVFASVASSWKSFAAVASGVEAALWLLPWLVALHIGQLFLAGWGWRRLFVDPVPGLAAFHRLRIIREGIDSLLPVAQIGGEVIGARLLAQRGLPPIRAGASVIVDVTVELVTQIAFLLTGLFLLAQSSTGWAWRNGLALLLGGAVTAMIVVVLQRVGALRLIEGLSRGIARRWPSLEGASLDGLHDEALRFYRLHVGLVHCVVLHYLAWVLGSIETWAVLNALAVPISPADSVIVESLGMAARSAGFAIPAALGAQEGGFILAAAAVGIGSTPALTLSLVKRLREILVGSLGMLLWRAAIRSR